MKILGIDPGYGIVGWSVVEGNLKLRGFGVINTSSKEEFPQRLLTIRTALHGLIDEFKPDCASIERLYFSRNTTTAIDVAKAIGVITLTLAEANLPITEYTPQQIKKALTGYARAEKAQMQDIIKKIFNLKEIPRPDDAADAVAIAACHHLAAQGSARIPLNMQ